MLVTDLNLVSNAFDITDITMLTSTSCLSPLRHHDGHHDGL